MSPTSNPIPIHQLRKRRDIELDTPTPNHYSTEIKDIHRTQTIRQRKTSYNVRSLVTHHKNFHLRSHSLSVPRTNHSLPFLISIRALTTRSEWPIDQLLCYSDRYRYGYCRLPTQSSRSFLSDRSFLFVCSFLTIRIDCSGGESV